MTKMKPSVVATTLITSLTLVGMSSSAWALYKVVEPDGRITYTDREPVNQTAQTIKANGATSSTENLPFELQASVGRYPVTLYTSKSCSPCDAGRDLLRSRGVPFTEKTVNTPDDVRQFRASEKTDQLPVVRIGAKQILGFSQGEWTEYLNAAGYPATSMLPRNYRQASPSPLVPPPAAKASEPAPSSSQSPDTSPASPAGNAPSGFRF